MTAREQLLKELTEAPENLVDELLAVCLERRRKLDARSEIDQALMEMLADPDYQADVWHRWKLSLQRLSGKLCNWCVNRYEAR